MGRERAEDVAGGVVVQRCEGVSLVASLAGGEGGGKAFAGNDPDDQSAVVAVGPG